MPPQVDGLLYVLLPFEGHLEVGDVRLELASPTEFAVQPTKFGADGFLLAASVEGIAVPPSSPPPKRLFPVEEVLLGVSTTDVQ